MVIKKMTEDDATRHGPIKSTGISTESPNHMMNGICNIATARKVSASPSHLSLTTKNSSVMGGPGGKCRAMKVRFFRNADPFHRGVVYAVSNNRYKDLTALMNDLNKSLGDRLHLPYGVRYIFVLPRPQPSMPVSGDPKRISGTTTGATSAPLLPVKLSRIDEFQDGDSCVCSSFDRFDNTTSTSSTTASGLWNTLLIKHDMSLLPLPLNQLTNGTASGAHHKPNTDYSSKKNIPPTSYSSAKSESPSNCNNIVTATSALNQSLFPHQRPFMDKRSVAAALKGSFLISDILPAPSPTDPETPSMPGEGRHNAFSQLTSQVANLIVSCSNSTPDSNTTNNNQSYSPSVSSLSNKSSCQQRQSSLIDGPTPRNVILLKQSVKSLSSSSASKVGSAPCGVKAASKKGADTVRLGSLSSTKSCSGTNLTLPPFRAVISNVLLSKSSSLLSLSTSSVSIDLPSLHDDAPIRDKNKTRGSGLDIPSPSFRTSAAATCKSPLIVHRRINIVGNQPSVLESRRGTKPPLPTTFTTPGTYSKAERQPKLITVYQNGITVPEKKPIKYLLTARTARTLDQVLEALNRIVKFDKVTPLRKLYSTATDTRRGIIQVEKLEDLYTSGSVFIACGKEKLSRDTLQFVLLKESVNSTVLDEPIVNSNNKASNFDHSSGVRRSSPIVINGYGTLPLSNKKVFNINNSPKTTPLPVSSNHQTSTCSLSSIDNNDTNSGTVTNGTQIEQNSINHVKINTDVNAKIRSSSKKPTGPGVLNRKSIGALPIDNRRITSSAATQEFPANKSRKSEIVRKVPLTSSSSDKSSKTNSIKCTAPVKPHDSSNGTDFNTYTKSCKKKLVAKPLAPKILLSVVAPEDITDSSTSKDISCRDVLSQDAIPAEPDFKSSNHIVNDDNIPFTEKQADASTNLEGNYQHQPVDDSTPCPKFITKKYEVHAIIGDGNFAIVKECQNKKTGFYYALKIIDKTKCKTNIEMQMIANEVSILRKISHPNIVQLFEEYETNTKLYLVMELVKGGDLFDLIARETKFGEFPSSRMIYDLTQALRYLHYSLNVVHRDIKPENLLVYEYEDGNRVLKLADFGLAIHITGPLYTVCGTPAYVAPEILAETGYGIKIDVWATGVITYILLCGFPPFDNKTGNQDDLFDMILTADVQFPSPFWTNVSECAKDLIKNMLQVDPNKRYSALDVLMHPWITTQITPPPYHHMMHNVSNNNNPFKNNYLSEHVSSLSADVPPIPPYYKNGGHHDLNNGYYGGSSGYSPDHIITNNNNLIYEDPDSTTVAYETDISSYKKPGFDCDYYVKDDCLNGGCFNPSKIRGTNHIENLDRSSLSPPSQTAVHRNDGNRHHGFLSTDDTTKSNNDSSKLRLNGHHFHHNKPKYLANPKPFLDDYCLL